MTTPLTTADIGKLVRVGDCEIGSVVAVAGAQWTVRGQTPEHDGDIRVTREPDGAAGVMGVRVMCTLLSLPAPAEANRAQSVCAVCALLPNAAHECPDTPESQRTAHRDVRPPPDPLRTIGGGGPWEPRSVGVVYDPSDPESRAHASEELTRQLREMCAPACDPVAPIVALVSDAAAPQCRGQACIAETFALRCKVDALQAKVDTAKHVSDAWAFVMHTLGVETPPDVDIEAATATAGERAHGLRTMVDEMRQAQTRDVAEAARLTMKLAGFEHERDMLRADVKRLTAELAAARALLATATETADAAVRERDEARADCARGVAAHAQTIRERDAALAAAATKDADWKRYTDALVTARRSDHAEAKDEAARLRRELREVLDGRQREKDEAEAHITRLRDSVQNAVARTVAECDAVTGALVWRWADATARPICPRCWGPMLRGEAACVDCARDDAELLGGVGMR